MATGIPNKTAGETLTAAEFNVLRASTDASEADRHNHTNKLVLDGTTASYTVADKAVVDSVDQTYTAMEKAKLAGVETGATGDLTGPEIKSLYEAEADTNALTDSDKSKLNSYSGRNLIINGDFSVWQRGTSQTITTYGSDDRWRNDHNVSTKVHTRQAFTVGQTDVPNNPKYYSRTVVTSVVGASSYVLKKTELESVATTAGKEVTLSFWAKADSVKNMAVEFLQNFGTGGSPSASVTGIDVTTFNLTTSWQKFTTTVTFPSIAGKTLGTNNNDSYQIYFWFESGSSFAARTNSLGQQSGTFDIANVQLEFGDTATEFEYVHPADQLARCQRYFQKSYIKDDSLGTVGSAGSLSYIAPNAGTAIYTVTLPQKLRAVPAITLYSSATGATGVIRDINAATDVSASVYQPGDSYFKILKGSAHVDGRTYEFHYAVDAEL